jgi:carboxyl-terminal processing protease
MRLVRKTVFALLILTLAAGSFGAGYVFRWRQTQTRLPLLEEAYQLLAEHGLKPLPAAPAMEYGMIRGMLQAYDDPYTTFLEPPQNELEGNRLEGRYGGIGADLEQGSDGFWRLFPFPDGPARKAGVLEGDRLLAVDDLQLTPETPADTVQAALRGPVGEKARLEIGRPPEFAPFEVIVEFAEYPLPSVTWRLATDEPRLGIAKVNLIAASTAEEILHAMQDLTQRGAVFYILDLRDNPGGLLDAGVNIARLFLKEGIVMEQQYRGQEVRTYRVEKPGPLSEIPLAVLINHGSASAAEITAGALKAQHRAPLIGAPSYGKDSIQLVFTLQDGSSLHVTSARWWIPGLQPPIGEGGLQPDILISEEELQTGADPFMQAALSYFLNTP